MNNVAEDLTSVRDQIIAYSVLVKAVNNGGVCGVSELGETLAEKLSEIIEELE
jgi:hypothetical protein